MMRGLAALGALLALAACTSPVAVQSQASGMRSAELRDGPGSTGGARYDHEKGACRDPGTQLLTGEQFSEIEGGWSGSEEGRVCSGPTKRKSPAAAAFPERFVKLQRAGSAQVLVLLEKDGRVVSAHAVCATDVEFGQAAVATALEIEYEPEQCDGQPVRSSFLLPFDYDWK